MSQAAPEREERPGRREEVAANRRGLAVAETADIRLLVPG
jgi:hypothetical protein